MFKLWADECTKCYGGMDLLAVDAVIDELGNYHILELNGTAIGIQPVHWQEDSMRLVYLVVDKMNTVFCDQLKEKPTEISENTPVPATEWNRLNKVMQNYEKEIATLRDLLKKEKDIKEKKEEGFLSSVFNF